MSVSLVLDLVAAAQSALAVRSYWRMLLGAAGDPIVSPPASAASRPGSVTIVVPVLDERARLGPCLDGLVQQDATVREILVVDGGSRDGTQALVRAAAARDARLRLVDAGAPPDGWNGKAWNLQTGLTQSAAESSWILTIDADVRPAPDLARALVAHAERSWLEAFSAAPLQIVEDAALAALHPALLATLVYRCGLPGRAASRPEAVQANGQCTFVRRELLRETRAIELAKASPCEDFTIARAIVRAGTPFGFFEAPLLASVEMYASAADCLANWPRSLLLRDAESRDSLVRLGLLEVALVQTLPLLLAVALGATGRRGTAAFRVNALLALARLGVLAGTRRAYGAVPGSYWLSPLADLAALFALARELRRPTTTWRGRALARELPAA